MIQDEVRNWLIKYRGRIRPETLASVADISIDTLRVGLRGAGWSSTTILKLFNAMEKLEKTQPPAKGLALQRIG